MTRFSRGLRLNRWITYKLTTNLLVSIWPDFQGDWDPYFSVTNSAIEIVSIWPDFQGDWDLVYLNLDFLHLARFNMTRFSRGLRLLLQIHLHLHHLSFNMTRFSRGLRLSYQFSNIYFFILFQYDPIFKGIET